MDYVKLVESQQCVEAVVAFGIVMIIVIMGLLSRYDDGR